MFGKKEYVRLAGISVSHIYNLTCATRQSTAASACACSTRRRGRWALPSDANPSRLQPRNVMIAGRILQGRLRTSHFPVRHRSPRLRRVAGHAERAVS